MAAMESIMARAADPLAHIKDARIEKSSATQYFYF